MLRFYFLILLFLSNSVFSFGQGQYGFSKPFVYKGDNVQRFDFSWSSLFLIMLNNV